MESLITKIRVEEEARKQDSKEDVFVVSKDNNKTPAHLKPKKEFMKPSHNQNQNRRFNQNKNMRIKTRTGTIMDPLQGSKHITITSLCVMLAINLVIWLETAGIAFL